MQIFIYTLFLHFFYIGIVKKLIFILLFVLPYISVVLLVIRLPSLRSIINLLISFPLVFSFYRLLTMSYVASFCFFSCFQLYFQIFLSIPSSHILYNMCIKQISIQCFFVLDQKLCLSSFYYFNFCFRPFSSCLLVFSVLRSAVVFPFSIVSL